MIKKPTTGIATAITLTAVMTLAPGYGHAALKDEMGKMFGDMSNVTDPQGFDTGRRGGISGGRVQTRSKIMNMDLVTFDPPGMQAGCGGIDFYGGSFSFINKDQFVELLRTVAQNAAGFAFQMAIKSMSAQLASTMEGIQEKIQQMNDMMGNSCQLAQGLVTNTKKAYEGKYDKEAGLAKNLKDGAADLFSANTNDEDTGTSSDGISEESKEQLNGNLVWEALNANSVAGWWTYGDENMLELIMSMSGTVIVLDGEDDPDTGTKRGAKTSEVPGGSPSLIDLVEGGNFSYLECDNDECMNPSLTGKELKGFEEIIEEKLSGNPETGDEGLIDKIANNEKLKAEDEKFLGALPSGLAGAIFRLSRVNQMLTAQFARSAIEPIALQMGYDMADSMLKSAESALQNQESPYAKDAIDRVKESRSRIAAEYGAKSASNSKLSDALKNYNAILQAVTEDSPIPSNQVPRR